MSGDRGTMLSAGSAGIGATRGGRAAGFVCIALGIGVAASSLLGPVGVRVIEYRTAETALNQLKGADLASLLLVAPAAVGAGVLWLRRHPLAPVAALAPAAYAAYTFTQAILGEEYARYDGNNERFFPLHLALVIAGGAIAYQSWRAIDPDAVAPPSRRLRRIAAVAFLGSAAFLTLGLHVPGLLAVWRGAPGVEYRDAPTAFWVVKLMDLGIIVPIAVATGVGLLRGSRAALAAAYGVSGVFALIGASVTCMAVIMQLNDDPAASPTLVAGFGVITAAFATLAVRLARSAVSRARPRDVIPVAFLRGLE
jgi:hypothetical protein